MLTLNDGVAVGDSLENLRHRSLHNQLMGQGRYGSELLHLRGEAVSSQALAAVCFASVYSRDENNPRPRTKPQPTQMLNLAHDFQVQ